MRYLAFLALFALAGCSYFSDREPPFGCPDTGFVRDTNRATFIEPDKKKKDPGLVAVLPGFTGECSFKKAGVVDETVTLPFFMRKGASAGALKEKKLSYFIAVLSPDEEVLQRKEFTTTVVFDETGTGKSEEEHTIAVPVPDHASAFRYKVVFGLTLTPDQLAYNKEH